MKIYKENLVFRWEWNENKINDFKKSGVWYSGDNYHCKDQLAISYFYNNELWLKDTYWGSSEYFRLEPKQFKDVKFKLIADLDEHIELKDRYEYSRKQDEYKQEDLLCLQIHAGYRNRYFIKKGSEPCIEIKKSKIQEKIDKYQREIESNQREIKWLKEDLSKLEME